MKLVHFERHCLCRGLIIYAAPLFCTTPISIRGDGNTLKRGGLLMPRSGGREGRAPTSYRMGLPLGRLPILDSSQAVQNP